MIKRNITLPYVALDNLPSTILFSEKKSTLADTKRRILRHWQLCLIYDGFFKSPWVGLRRHRGFMTSNFFPRL